MVDAVISVVVERVANIIVDQIRYEFNLVRGVEKELLDLSDKLENIKNVLNDAEMRGVNNHRVKGWLKKLENTAYEMDDILDEWNYTLVKYEVEALPEPEPEPEPEPKIGCSFIPYPCLRLKKVSIRHDTAKKIENVKAKLDQILKEKDGFNFAISVPTDPAPNQSISLIDMKKVHGLDIWRMKNDIVRKLLNADNNKILSIVGTGGLGKTTLAQLIFNDPQFVKDWLKIWVCVSIPFDVVVVAKNIVELVRTEMIPLNFKTEELALQKLIASISGKKFLLVLDDVWTEEEAKWERLKLALQCGAPCSKILVTTRNERVAEIMGTSKDDMYRPTKLRDDECWSLLRDTSLPDKSEEECEKFEIVGKKIASKCKGLPLAAVVLGRLLRFKDLEGWKHVEKSEIWQLKNEEVKLFPHLVLSYNDLSQIVKRCFSYCAIYPKNYRIHAESLIEEWMALGYLGSVSGKDGVEIKGQEYLKILATRSFFHDIEKSESGEEIEWCKMHDVLHDFALFLRKNDYRERNCQVCDSSSVSHVQEYRCLSWDHIPPVDERERGGQVCDCLKSLRVLRFKRGPPPLGMEKLIHLRCLDFSGVALSNDDLKIICQLYLLQTLLLSVCSIKTIPREIGNLVQLRRLVLSYNELYELPESIYNLVELQYLSLEHCSLKQIHSGIGNLVQLRRLDLCWNKELKKLPDSICHLVELQILMIQGTYISCLPEAIDELSNLRILELSALSVGSHYNNFGLLKKSNCTRYLRLEIYLNSMSEMVELIKDARQAQVEMFLQKLDTLIINFDGRINEEEQSLSLSTSMWMEIVEAVVPHHKLEELKIKGYKGSRLPHLMSSPFNFVKQIDLKDLSEVASLPAMGKLPLLEYLSITRVEKLKFVGREFLGLESSSHDAAVVAFPKLNHLSFFYFHIWEEWEDITEEEEESAAISIMPCLTGLSIRHCESLKKLPHRLLHKVSSSLRSLDIGYSLELEKTYKEDKEGSAWRSISQHNPQLRRWY